MDPPCAQTGVKSSLHTYVLIPEWRLHKESMIVCLKKKKLLIKDPCPMAIHSEHAKNCVPTVMSQLN